MSDLGQGLSHAASEYHFVTGDAGA